MSNEESKPKRWVLIDCPNCGGTHELYEGPDGIKLVPCEKAPENEIVAYARGLDIRELT